MQIPSQHGDAIQLFVADCKIRLQNLLGRLDWTEEGVLKNFNSNSLASTQTVPKESKQPEMATTSTFPDSCITNNSMFLRTPKLQRLLEDSTVEAPENFDDLQRNFTRDQKLKIYEHTILHTKKLDNNTVDEVPEGAVSLAEIVAEARREAKRKKRKFRITKPTRIEEVRALVQLQMQAMEKFIANQRGDDAGIMQESAGDIQLETEDRADDGRGIRSWEKNDYRNTFSTSSGGYQGKRETYHKHQKEKSSWEYKKYGAPARDYGERRERIPNRSPESTRYKSYEKRSRSPKSNSSQRGYRRNPESTKYYEESSRRGRRSPESKMCYEESSRRRCSRSPEERSRRRCSRSPEESSRRRRIRSPYSTKYYEESSRKRYDKYDRYTRDHRKRRSPSPLSTERKRHKNYYRRSKSPQESHHSGSHSDRVVDKDHRQRRSSSRERHRYRKSRSRSKTQVYRKIGDTQIIVKLQMKT